MLVSLILFIVILGLVVLVHEFGHFIFAKIFGVKVFEFSIGMGPKLFQHEAKSGTKYSIRGIPIGGYVALAGEDPDDLETCKEGERLPDKPAWQRCIIMGMGVVNNFIFAFIVLLLSASIFGATDLTPVVSKVTDNYPAQEAGFTAGDKILAINGHKVTYVDDVNLYFVVEDLDKEVKIEVLKADGETTTYNLLATKTQDSDGNEKYKIGIEFSSARKHDIGSVMKYTVDKTLSIFKQMFVTFGSLFSGKVSVKELSGPVGIYTVVDKAKSYGVESLLYLIALLCINVGIINILPFPAFDGGRIFLLIIEKIIGRPISPKIENTINTIGFVLLIGLMIYVTFNDILRLF